MTAISEQETDMKQLTKNANEYGSEFVEVYYKTLDSKRHDLPKYYMPESKVIWNGNEIQAESRQAFHFDLPDTRHYIECFDIHPILNEFNQTGHYMLLISVSGTCSYKNHDAKLFFQNFMLACRDDKWKIVSDCYRFAE